MTLLEIGFLRGLFFLWNCWYFFSFSLSSVWLRIELDLGSSLLVCHELNTPWQNFLIKVCSTFQYQFYPSFSFNIIFGSLCNMTEVTFEESINLLGYLRSLSHVPTLHLSCPIFSHWWRACLLFIFTKK